MPFRLPEILVVTGYQSDEVTKVLEPYPVRTILNSRYAKGEMLSSLQTGLRALGEEIDACLVVMGDQPHLKPRLVRQILALFAEGQGTLIAPRYGEQRGHPILIHRRYFPELLALPQGSAPRDVINRHPVTTFPVDNDSILRDIDTPEQYTAEKRRASLD
jgi:molybdenum cofactor cytidylyltransferase